VKALGGSNSLPFASTERVVRRAYAGIEAM
jgi:hypothetical protein